MFLPSSLFMKSELIGLDIPTVECQDYKKDLKKKTAAKSNLPVCSCTTSLM